MHAMRAENNRQETCKINARAIARKLFLNLFGLSCENSRPDRGWRKYCTHAPQTPTDNYERWPHAIPCCRPPRPQFQRCCCRRLWRTPGSWVQNCFRFDWGSFLRCWKGTCGTWDINIEIGGKGAAEPNFVENMVAHMALVHAWVQYFLHRRYPGT